MEDVTGDDVRAPPTLSVTRLAPHPSQAENGQRRSSYMLRRPKTRRSSYRRSLSQGKLFRRVVDLQHQQQQDTTSSQQPEEFIFQQPAYDPDLLRQQQLPATATGSNRRGWNTQMALYVKRMGQRAGGYKWMHGQSSRYFTKRYQLIGITAIIVNALATAGNIPYVASCQTDLNWIKIVAIILGFLVTVTMAFQQFKDYGARKSQHTTGEANYAALYDHIQQQLRKNSRDRQDANDYVEWIAKELNDLKGASPLIPPSILSKYRGIIHGQNIADPEGIDEIVIKTDSPERDEELIPQQSRRRRSVQQRSEVVEVVVDPGPPSPSPRVPRSGRLLVTYNDDARTAPPPQSLSEKDRIALERWNDYYDE
jgi:hypothetical protein